MESESQLQNSNASLAPNMESLALGGLMMLVVANFRADKVSLRLQGTGQCTANRKKTKKTIDHLVLAIALWQKRSSIAAK